MIHFNAAFGGNMGSAPVPTSKKVDSSSADTTKPTPTPVKPAKPKPKKKGITWGGVPKKKTNASKPVPPAQTSQPPKTPTKVFVASTATPSPQMPLPQKPPSVTQATVKSASQQDTSTKQSASVPQQPASPKESPSSSTAQVNPLKVVPSVLHDNEHVEELEARVARLELLMEISRQFNSNLDFDKLMDTIFEKVLMVLEAEAGSCWIPDTKTNELVCRVAEGPAKKQVIGLRLAEGTGIVGWVMQNRQKTVIFDASKDERFSSKVDEKTHFVTKSMLCVPLVVKDECVAAIQVINKKTVDGQFTKIDLEALESLANSGAIAIKNARLYQSEQRIKELNTLLHISQELTSTLDLDRVLISLVNMGSQVIHYKRAVIGLLGTHDEVVLAAESNQAVPDLRSEENVKLKAIFDQVMASKNSLYINRFNPEKPPKGVSDKVIDYLKVQELHCLSVIILSDSEGQLGILSMEGVYSSLVGNQSQYIITMLVNQATVAIRNAQLYQNIPSSGVVERFKSNTLLSREKLNLFAKIGVIAFFALIAALFLPFPSNITTEVEVVPEHRTQVTVQQGGVVKAILFKEGDLLTKGQLLMKLDSSELLLEKAKLQKDHSITESDLRLHESRGDAGASLVARLSLEKLDNALATIEYQLQATRVQAPNAGRVLLPKPEELLDKQLIEGEVITEIAIDDRKSVHLYIQEEDILQVHSGDSVTFILQGFPGISIAGQLQAISQVKFEKEEEEESEEPSHYIGYLTSEQLNTMDTIRFGMTGAAKIHVAPKTLYQLYIEPALRPYLTQIKLLFE